MSTNDKDGNYYNERREELKRAAQRFYDELTPEEKAYAEKVKKERAPFYDAERRYLEAGLGEPMCDPKSYAPQEARDYPGGPVAVYEEAIRRGVTWEEVCGYEPPDYRYVSL